MTTTLSTETLADTAVTTESSVGRPKLAKTVAAAAGMAAVATMAVAALAHAAGASLETEPGQPIPVLGFGQVTIFFVLIGALIAWAIGRRASHPHSTFVRTTVVLTALSVLPDLMLSAESGTKLTLIATHLVAAAIVIPWLASRLPE